MYTPAARSAALPSAFAFHRFRPALVAPPAFLGLDAFRKPPPLPLVPAALGTHGAVPVAASALVRVRVKVRVRVGVGVGIRVWVRVSFRIRGQGSGWS